MMKCIYGIINLTNNKKYIGSTSNFARRKKEHLNMLRNNRHHSIYLQNAFNKYNEDNFKFIIFEKLDNLQNIYEIEQIYLDKYETYNRTNGYNMCKYSNSINNDLTKKMVLQFDYVGNLLNKFESLNEASIFLKCNYSTISLAAKGKNRTAKGFIWIFEKDYSDELLNSKILNLYNNHSDETIKLMKLKSRNRDVYNHILQFDKNNILINEFKSIREANRITGVSINIINAACHNIYKTNRSNFLWEIKKQ